MESGHIMLLNEFLQQRQLLSEAKKTYDYGCIMLAASDKPPVVDIDNEDLYTDPAKPGKYGRETEAHVTVLYGIHADAVGDEEPLDLVKQKTAFYIALTGVSLFENDEYDVVKFSVASAVLHDLNALTRASYPYTSTFPDYVPHMTIAYVKPGTGKKYVKSFDEPVLLRIDSAIYSRPDGTKSKGKLASPVLDEPKSQDLAVQFYKLSQLDHASLTDAFTYLQQCADNGVAGELTLAISASFDNRVRIINPSAFSMAKADMQLTGAAGCELKGPQA